MSVTVTALSKADIPGAIECIQQAFADDPYNHWVFDRKTVYQFPNPLMFHCPAPDPPLLQFSLARNSVSLGIRCQWGIRNALFYVAKDASTPIGETQGSRKAVEHGKVLGVACWMPPRQAGQPESWEEWLQGWLLWGRQVAMNLWWGRGGLNVEVGLESRIRWT